MNTNYHAIYIEIILKQNIAYGATGWA